MLSCSKGVGGPDGPKDDFDQKIPLEFTAFVDWEVKSLVNDADDLQKYSISLLANATLDDKTYAVFDNEMLNYTEDEWTYETARYWIPGARYSFAAFAPFAQEGSPGSEPGKLSSGTVSLSNSEGNPVLTITGYKTKTEDLLVAHYVRDNSMIEDYSAVPLTFGHILSGVTFSIRNTTNDDITKVSDIKLSGLSDECNITLTTAEVTVDSSNKIATIASEDRLPQEGSTCFLPKGMSEADFRPLFDCEILALLPQQLYGKEISLTFKIHKGNTTTDYSLNLGNIEKIRDWKPGNKYNYSISITSKDILFQVVEVPWIEHEVEL